MPSPIVVSVLMTVFNTKISYVKRAIDSLMSQDFQAFELIIIDDGSLGVNCEALMHYVEKYEDKVTYIRHSNRGQSESINRWVASSSGKFISILDSDDEYKPNHLSSCLREIVHYDLICSNTETVVDSIDDYYVPDKNDTTKLIHLDETVLFGTLFGRREVFEQINFRSGFAADAAFYEQARSQFRVHKVNLRTYVYHRNIPGSICANMKKANLMNS